MLINEADALHIRGAKFREAISGAGNIITTKIINLDAELKHEKKFVVRQELLKARWRLLHEQVAERAANRMDATPGESQGSASVVADGSRGG